MQKNCPVKVKKYSLYTALLIYILLASYLLIFKYVSPMVLFDANRYAFRSINPVPFGTISGYLSGSLNVSQTVVISNVIGNTVVFIPLGILLSLFRKDKRITTNLLWVFFISLSVEIIQYMFRLGASDIDDLILNSLGGLIGIICCRLELLFSR